MDDQEGGRLYSRIVVPLDGSEVAETSLRYARPLARCLGASVRLVRVVEPPVLPGLEEMGGAQDLTGIIDTMRREAGEYLAGVAGGLQTLGVPVSNRVIEGRAGPAIVEEAAAEPGSLIAMSARGRSVVSRWLLGSVTDRVLHTAASPLLVVRSSAGETSSEDAELSSLVVAADSSETSEHVLPHVVALAREVPMAVVLVRVTQAPREFEGHEDRVASRYLADLAARLREQGVATVDERVAHRDTAEALLTVAEETPGSLVAMASHGRAAPGRLLIGSVTDRVVHHASGPVLIVRPPQDD